MEKKDMEDRVIYLAQEVLMQGPSTASEIAEYINGYRGWGNTPHEIAQTIRKYPDIFKGFGGVRKTRNGPARPQMWMLAYDPFIRIRPTDTLPDSKGASEVSYKKPEPTSKED